MYTGERWGDYVGVAQDPLVPSAVWQANQYSGTGTNGRRGSPASRPPGTTYVPITPVRVLDSRGGAGPTGKFSANVARTWQVTGVGGIPANAVAVTGNVTVTGQTGRRLRVGHPDRDQHPAVARRINFPVGDDARQQRDRGAVVVGHAVGACSRPAPARRPTSSST